MKRLICCLIIAYPFLFFPISSFAAPTITITIDGITGDLLTNAQNSLSLEHEKESPTLSDSRIDRLYANGIDEITRSLQPYGYYNAQITPSITRSDDAITIQYQVDPGPPVIIDSLDLDLLGDASSDPTFIELFAQKPFALDQQLNQIEYDHFKNQVQDLSAARGYLDAQFVEHSIVINTDTNRAAIRLIFSSGQRYLFGEITYDQTHFNESFLNRFLNFSPGDPYLSSKLLEVQHALNDNNYFNSVEIVPELDQIDNLMIPILIKLVPRKPMSVGIGAGYGTDTGARARLDWQWYRVTETGHQFLNFLRVSQFRQTAESRYVIPGSNPITDQYALSAVYVDDRPRNNVIQSRTAQLSGSHLTGDPLYEWSRVLSLNIQTERFDEVDGRSESHLFYPAISYERIFADDRFNPEHGLSLRFDSKGALKTLASSSDFIQFEAQGKYIRSITERNRVLLRSNLGITFRDDINNIPPSLRFFAGGDNSVRGYAFESLGPVEKNDSGKFIVVGGAYLAVGSIEWEHTIKNNWSVAAFYDVGNAFSHVKDFSVEQGAGVGVRWRSPVGPIRLDFAHPFSDDPRLDRLVRIHFTLGPDL